MGGEVGAGLMVMLVRHKARQPEGERTPLYLTPYILVC